MVRIHKNRIILFLRFCEYVFLLHGDLFVARRKFLTILTMMTEDWNDCVDSDVIMRETVYKAKLANRITNAMFTLHVLTIVAYSIGVFLADVDITDHQSELPLLLKVELPISINTKRTYKMLLAAQFVHLIMSGCGTGLLNALLLTLVKKKVLQLTHSMMYDIKLVERSKRATHV